MRVFKTILLFMLGLPFCIADLIHRNRLSEKVLNYVNVKIEELR